MALNRRAFLAAASATALTPLPAAALTETLGGVSGAWPWSTGGEPASATDPLPDTRWLMPVPAQRQFRPGRFAITPQFTAAATQFSDRRLEQAITRALTRMNHRTGWGLDVYQRAPAGQATLTIACQRQGNAIPAMDDDESYRLEVRDDGVLLEAAEVVGALRGLETLNQLIEGDAEGPYLPLASIQDRPRFRWRGLLLDVSRHWEPVEVVKRTLDGMAMVKLNVFHWHLSDDQGFRAECHTYPRLTGMGSDGNFYTQEQIRDVIAYAADRGIRVLPEFDMPGHCTSWLVGYPDLGSAPGPYHIARIFGILPNAFDPANEHLYPWLDKFFAEMTALFPDAYFHIGGDENKGPQWTANPRIQRFMREHHIANNKDLQTYFNRRIAPLVAKHGKHMVGWEEILNPELPDDVAVEAWLGIPAVNEIARDGHMAILSAGYYLDLMWSAEEHYLVDPIPADTPLTPEQQKRVLGGEAAMWGERVDPFEVDSRIWPRLAPIAERFWSPREIRDVPDMYRRMGRISVELEDAGLHHRSNPQRLLSWLTGGADTAPLAVLMGAVEPRKGYGWHHSKSVFSPQVYFVYAIPPESPLRRALPAMVEQLLADAPRFADRREDLEALFASWQQAQAGIEALAARQPMLEEVLPFATDLRACGEIGAQSLDYLAAHQTAPADWKASALARLEAMAPVRADMRMIVLDPLRGLVLAASNAPAAPRGLS
ncbi:MAG: beta-N-acetylhexosaminidase [Terriglobales bacterium]